MSRYITSIGGSRNKSEEEHLQAQGFLKIPASLKQDNFGNAVHLWSKKNEERRREAALTRIQVSFNDDMSEGLTKAGYTKAFDEIPTLEGPVSIWYFCGTTPYDIPMEELGFSTTPKEEAEKIKEGWEKVGCNFSDVYGRSLYFWVKREKQTYICDVTATNSYDRDSDLFQEGYIRMDETTNTIFSGFKSTNFLWYRLTTDAESAILDLKISANCDEYQQYQQEGYTLIDVNLNKGTGGRTVFLWYMKDGFWSFLFPHEKQPPVATMQLFHYKFAFQFLETKGVTIIEKNINEGNCGGERYLCSLVKPLN